MSLDFEQIFLFGEQIGFKRLEDVAGYDERRLRPRCRRKGERCRRVYTNHKIRSNDIFGFNVKEKSTLCVGKIHAMISTKHCNDFTDSLQGF